MPTGHISAAPKALLVVRLVQYLLDPVGFMVHAFLRQFRHRVLGDVHANVLSGHYLLDVHLGQRLLVLKDLGKVHTV